jgi:CBS domain-containing protein
MKTVREFMNKDVVYVSPDDTIFDVAKLLSQLNIAGAPVVEKEKIVGIISISDIIKFIDIKLGVLPKINTPGLSSLLLALVQMQKIHMDFKKEIEKITKFKVKEVMSKNVITISPKMTLLEVAEIIEKHDFNRFPVVENGKLVGIVARADLIKALIY